MEYFYIKYFLKVFIQEDVIIYELYIMNYKINLQNQYSDMLCLTSIMDMNKKNEQISYD